jgi:hypothetical protein
MQLNGRHAYDTTQRQQMGCWGIAPNRSHCYRALQVLQSIAQTYRALCIRNIQRFLGLNRAALAQVHFE